MVQFFYWMPRHLETAAAFHLHRRRGNLVAIRVKAAECQRAHRNTVTDLDLLLEEVDFVLLLQKLLLLPRDLCGKRIMMWKVGKRETPGGFRVKATKQRRRDESVTSLMGSRVFDQRLSVVVIRSGFKSATCQPFGRQFDLNPEVYTSRSNNLEKLFFYQWLKFRPNFVLRGRWSRLSRLVPASGSYTKRHRTMTQSAPHDMPTSLSVTTWL